MLCFEKDACVKDPNMSENTSSTSAVETITPPKNSKKLENARAKLPTLSPNATGKFGELTKDLDITELDSLAAHLAFYARSKRTLAANDATVALGQVVRVVSGQADLVGKVGTVAKLNRIRCYVEIEEKQHYLFTSDVVPVKTEQTETVESPEVNESVAQENAVAV